MEQPLRRYRRGRGGTLGEFAEHFGVSKTTVARWETGEMLPDADVIARIEDLTEGAVTAADMHRTRLGWLKANRPERFAAGGLAETAS